MFVYCVLSQGVEYFVAANTTVAPVGGSHHMRRTTAQQQFFIAQETRVSRHLMAYIYARFSAQYLTVIYFEIHSILVFTRPGVLTQSSVTTTRGRYAGELDPRLGVHPYRREVGQPGRTYDLLRGEKAGRGRRSSEIRIQACGSGWARCRRVCMEEQLLAFFQQQCCPCLFINRYCYKLRCCPPL